MLNLIRFELSDFYTCFQEAKKSHRRTEKCALLKFGKLVIPNIEISLTAENLKAEMLLRGYFDRYNLWVLYTGRTIEWAVKNKRSFFTARWSAAPGSVGIAAPSLPLSCRPWSATPRSACSAPLVYLCLVGIGQQRPAVRAPLLCPGQIRHLLQLALLIQPH